MIYNDIISISGGRKENHNFYELYIKDRYQGEEQGGRHWTNTKV